MEEKLNQCMDKENKNKILKNDKKHREPKREKDKTN